MKTLSFIIPAFNACSYIERCIKSIVSQEISDYEIIVVDYGSVDATPKLLEKLQKECEELIIIRKANGGVSSARNVGTNAASGKWIMFVDADDYLLPNSLGGIMAKINAEKDVHLHVFGMQRIARNGTIYNNSLNDKVLWGG